MKVLFLYLPHPYLNQPNSQIPLGLLYLASVLEEHKIEVVVKNYSTYSTNQAIADLPEADLYGITITSMELLQANRFSKLIKDKYPKAKVGLGGPGTCTNEYVDWNTIDYICIGEAEKTILKIISDFKSNKLEKIYYGDFESNLDHLSFPARHLLKDNLGGNVFAYNANYKDGGTTVIMTARGCPFSCAFCANPHITKMGGGKVRYRSADSIYKEMKYVIDTYGIRQFRISDDLFSFDKNRVMEVCKQIKKLDVIWRISARVKPFDLEVAKTMFEAGCREVSFGIESFDDDVLKLLNKGTTAEDNRRGLEIAHSAGLTTRCLMMIRTPGQTINTVPRNMAYMDKIPFDIASCTMFVPMPGSDIWNNPSKYKIEIINRDLDEYNFYFFGSEGKNKLKNIIKINDRDMDEVNRESYSFIDYLQESGKLNVG